MTRIDDSRQSVKDVFVCGLLLVALTTSLCRAGHAEAQGARLPSVDGKAVYDVPIRDLPPAISAAWHQYAAALADRPRAPDLRSMPRYQHWVESYLLPWIARQRDRIEALERWSTTEPENTLLKALLIGAIAERISRSTIEGPMPQSISGDARLVELYLGSVRGTVASNTTTAIAAWEYCAQNAGRVSVSSVLYRWSRPCAERAAALRSLLPMASSAEPAANLPTLPAMSTDAAASASATPIDSSDPARQRSASIHPHYRLAVVIDPGFQGLSKANRERLAQRVATRIQEVYGRAGDWSIVSANVVAETVRAAQRDRTPSNFDELLRWLSVELGPRYPDLVLASVPAGAPLLVVGFSRIFAPLQATPAARLRAVDWLKAAEALDEAPVGSIGVIRAPIDAW